MSGYVNPEAAAGRARAQQFNEALGAGAREIIPGLVEVEDIVPVGPGYRFPDHIAGFTAFGLDMKNKSYPTESSSAHYGSTSLRLICQAADEGKTTGAVAYVVWAVVMWLRKRGLYICIDDYGRINNPTHHLEELTRLLRRKRRAGDADAIFRADDGTPLLAKTVAMINRLLLHRDKLYVQHMLGRLVLGICGSNDDADGHAILFATDKKRTGKAQEVVKEHRLKVNGSYMMAKSLGCGDLLHGVLPQARVASWSAVFGYTDDPSKETPWIAERERLVWGPLREKGVERVTLVELPPLVLSEAERQAAINEPYLPGELDEAIDRHLECQRYKATIGGYRAAELKTGCHGNAEDGTPYSVIGGRTAGPINGPINGKGCFGTAPDGTSYQVIGGRTAGKENVKQGRGFYGKAPDGRPWGAIGVQTQIANKIGIYSEEQMALCAQRAAKRAADRGIDVNAWLVKYLSTPGVGKVTAKQMARALREEQGGTLQRAESRLATALAVTKETTKSGAPNPARARLKGLGIEWAKQKEGNAPACIHYHMYIETASKTKWQQSVQCSRLFDAMRSPFLGRRSHRRGTGCCLGWAHLARWRLTPCCA